MIAVALIPVSINDYQHFFDSIHAAWKPFDSSHRIIPFCTPIVPNADAIVIGMNHSDFVPNGGTESDRIAQQFSQNLPTENTFLEHGHKFSQGIRGVCDRASLDLNNKWMGTNRCAVQTGPDGIGELLGNQEYESCQAKMDEILQSIVETLTPKNVILVGKFAAELYYPDAQKQKFDDLFPRLEPLNTGASFTKLIPIKHVSRGSFWKSGAARLRDHFVH